MSLANLRILGGVELTGSDGSPVRSVLAQPKRLALLIYLAAARGALHRRDTLLALFWPETDATHARGALNRSVYFLRQRLGPELIVTHGDEQVGVAGDRLRCDSAEFEAALANGNPEHALDLYRGDLAPGFLVADAPGFERWLEGERTRLRTHALEAALGLAGRAGQERSERWAERATMLAPLDERAARLRMTLLDRLGDRGRALRAFEELQHRLQSELEVAPAPETLALARAIRARAGPGLEPAVRQPPAAAAPPAELVAPPGAVPRRMGRMVPIGLALLLLAAWLVTGPMRGRSLLLSSGRWAQITSEEGLDFQPALSPDGSEVAYATRRAGRLVIAVRSARGGESGEHLPALEIPGDQGLATWSADGELIRFTTIIENGPDAGWWEVGRLGGTPRPVPLPRNSRWMAWSRDGERIALAAGDSFFVTRRREPGLRALPRTADLVGLHSLAWSPDERWIAFVEGNPLWPTGRNTASSAVCLLDPATGRVIRVTDSRQLNVSPAWLDARTLLFISARDGPRELFAVGVGPDGPRGGPRKLPGGTDAHSISVSANGSRLALSRMEVRTELRRFDLPAGRIPGLGSGQTIFNGNQVIESHDVSADGHLLLFDSNRGGSADLYRLQLDAAAQPVPLVAGPGDQFFPQLSPDGAEIAYYGGPGQSSLWLIPAAGGTPSRVSDSNETVVNPLWSPDGLSLAYWSPRDGRMEVWIRSRAVRGGGWSGAKRVTDFGCYLAAWAPSGDGVICRSADGRALILVSLDGVVSWRRDLTAIGFSRNPMVASSPGDTALYFVGRRGADVGVWLWPLSGAPPRLVLRADDPTLDLLHHPGSFTVRAGRLVTTVGRMDSDIWVTDLH